MAENSRVVGLLVLWAGLLGCVGDETTRQHHQPATAGGLVVESVGPYSVADRAGLQQGDILLTWTAEAREPQPLSHGFHLYWLEYEQAARSPVVFEVGRGKQHQTVHLGPGTWKLEARPRLPDELLARYLEAQEVEQSGDPTIAVNLYRRTAKAALDANPLTAIFLFERSAAAAVERQLWELAQDSLEQAIAIARDADIPGWVAKLTLDRALVFHRQGDATAAAASYSFAADLLVDHPDLQLIRTQVLQRRAEARMRSGHLAEAEADMRAALAIRQQHVPDSLWVGRSLGGLATVLLAQGHFEEARQQIQQALAVEEQYDPGSTTAGAYFSNLAMIAHYEGDLITAEALLHRYLRILEERHGDLLRRASVSNNLSALRVGLGDLQGAEDLLRESIALKTSVGSEDMTEVAMSLTSLAEVQRLRANAEQAQATALRALAILERVAPDSVPLSTALGCLGAIARDLSEFRRAEDYSQRALKILYRRNPGSFQVARVLSSQAATALATGDLERAEKLARKALEIESQVIPESEAVIKTRGLLGQILYRRQKLDEAAAQYHQTLDALDALARHQGRSDLRQILFWHKTASYYSEALEIAVELGRPEDAYTILERSRARSLLRLLADRGIETEPRDLWAELRQLGKRYEASQAAMAKLSVLSDQEDIARLSSELRELRRRQEYLWEQAAASQGNLPRLVRPLDADQVRAALDPGTLLLAFSVGEQRTTLLALTRDQRPHAFAVDLGAGELSRQVRSLRSDIHSGRRATGASGIRLRSAQRRAQELYRQLLSPAEKLISKAERLLISPDSSLHDLPFAALVTTAEAGGPVEYLIERRPLHLVLSGTLLAMLRSTSPRSPSHRLVAFGDPIYGTSGASMSDVVVPSLSKSFGDLPYLPGSRREVEKITALFPDSRAYLGAEATEEAVRQLGSVDYLHLACHGLVDPVSPLDSAIALTLPSETGPDTENGLLQAWEILQDLRLKNQLVVLSACRSASGRSMGGAGRVGLTWAFQAAGARSVVAPLWNIRDDVAPDFMARFYLSLRAGMPKDEALRQAQLSILSLDASAVCNTCERPPPYLWAAFQLYGDRH